MLNKALLLKELERVAPDLFIDDRPAFDLARDAWKKLCADPLFIHKIKQVEAPWPVPTWDGAVDQTYAIKPMQEYTIFSVDGSQIYPDRHQGVSCYLINVGGVSITYGSENPVSFFSEPHLFTQVDAELEVSTELVNAKRQELELQAGVERAPDDALLLFDGSLIFWHLEAKDPILKELFFSRYVASLFSLYKKKILTASYISAPKSRELVNLVRLQLCDFDTTKTELFEPIARLKDSSVCNFFLPEQYRTTVFKNHSKISEQYPEPVAPYFFYINVGSEMGRVEIPAWIALDDEKTNYVASVVLDQCIKGRGYPVAIAESHEQAVVKGPDREFFYHVLNKMGMEREQHFVGSIKSLKKKFMTV